MICPKCKKILSEKRQIDTDPQFIYFSCSCSFSIVYETLYYDTSEPYINADYDSWPHNISQENIDQDFQRKTNPKGRYKLK